MGNKEKMNWHVGMNPGPIVYGEHGEQIADCRSPNFTSNESGQHAKLIAAAPQLLKTLQQMLSITSSSAGDRALMLEFKHMAAIAVSLTE